MREVPDVSANADPYSGYVIYYDGSWQGGWGGTSAATPLWGAIAALTDASPFCSAYGSGTARGPPAGAVRHDGEQQVHDLQRRLPQILRDITSGNNDYTPSGYSGGLYPATAGYDLALRARGPDRRGTHLHGRCQHLPARLHRGGSAGKWPPS